MQILPVLDIQQGTVVRGVGGRRHEYQPIVSKWTPSSEPVAVTEALRDAFGFRSFYLADLDAIGGKSPNWDLYARLQERGFLLAVDAGVRDETDGRRLLEAGVDCVAGLETIDGPAALLSLLDLPGGSRLIFSLDLKDGQPLGAVAGWRAGDACSIGEEAIEAGVRRLIVLDLARVGGGGGVGTEDLCLQIKKRHPQVELIAGGGVRGVEDLRRLESYGVDRALVASALHDGRVAPEDIRAFLQSVNEQKEA
jgi:phosphoribosylformimino-5-aminoimidazole carboxamide ribotide isomerase